MLKNINHVNLVAYIGAWDEENRKASAHHNVLYIVTEFCQGGDLLQLLITDTPLSWGFRLKMAHDIICGLMYLHSHHLIHRDIKSANVLLDHNWTCKISDFGMATTLKEEADPTKRMTYCGTEPYMAPELLFEEEYGVEADIFSYGMMLLEIMKRRKIGEDNFGIRPPSKLFHLDVELTRSQMPPDAPGSLVVMALQCVSFESSDRPSSEEIIEWVLDLMEEEPLKPSDLPMLPPCSDQDFFDTAPSTPVKAESETVKVRASNEKPAPILKARTLNTVELSEATVKSGYLHKRKSAAMFSVWRQRWFVMTKNHLSWYGSKDDMVVRRGRIDLRGVKVLRTIQLRFVILGSKDEADYNQNESTNKYAHREFAASSEEELTDWIECIQLVAGISVSIPPITDASSTIKSISTVGTPTPVTPALSAQTSLVSNLNGDGGAHKGNSTNHREGNCPTTSENVVGDAVGVCSAQTIAAFINRVPLYSRADLDISVNDWLEAIGLAREYGDTFNEKGYDSLQHIRTMGLSDSDFEYLGIVNPLHRRMLHEAAGSRFSPGFRCTITDIKEFGKATMYRVVAQYRYHRSLVYMRYSEFDQMNALILKLMKRTPETEALIARLPRMPAKGIATFGTGNDALRASRRVHLENYLNELHKVIRGI